MTRPPEPVHGLIAAERTDERHDDDESQVEQFAVCQKTGEQRNRLTLEKGADQNRHIAVLLDPRSDFVHLWPVVARPATVTAPTR